eukprot:6567778-Pyramimonas_sp.AAC.1
MRLHAIGSESRAKKYTPLAAQQRQERTVARIGIPSWPTEGPLERWQHALRSALVRLLSDGGDEALSFLL